MERPYKVLMMTRGNLKGTLYAISLLVLLGDVRVGSSTRKKAVRFWTQIK